SMSKFRNFFRCRRRRGSSKKDENNAENADKTENNDQESNKKNAVDPEVIPTPLAENENPTYFHVGRCAKECLLQGFKLGVWQLICSTLTKNGYLLSTFGEAYPDARDVFGGVEVFKELGNFTLSQSWLTPREFLTELTLHVDSSYGSIQTSVFTKDPITFQSKLKLGFDLSPIKVELVVPIYKEPLAMGYILATPVENCLVGYRTVYNLDEKAFDMHAFCLGYYNGKTEVGLKLENFKNLRGSIFQRINEHWAFAVKANLYSRENVKQVSVGGQYDFGDGTLVKVRLREDTRIGVVYQAEISKSLNVMYHLGFDLADPKGGAHKIGASLEFSC
ncbi:hypothetical protein KR038_010985, partial [Drosophila bunnanda]